MTTDHFIDIYTTQAAAYHRMIEPEDVDGQLRPAIERITPLAGRRILDLGTGSGRLPLLIGNQAAQLVGLDLHAAMLAEQQHRRQQRGGSWSLLQADMRRLPLADGWADVVLAGWAIGHLVGWHGDRWPHEVQQVVAEMERLAAPGGALIIMETLSTGSLTPAPPTPGLARYYHWLETEQGFSRQEIRTDYQFGSVDEAVAKTAFFFGPQLAQTIRDRGWARVPEWTGVWSKRTPGPQPPPCPKFMTKLP
ncbi:MAG: class I SAM-dependent methyltransferase [Anaerolineae bacterium]|nr:class I SAM-dependent methyltransferase [Anaerolineae bacterium]